MKRTIWQLAVIDVDLYISFASHRSVLAERTDIGPGGSGSNRQISNLPW